MQTAIGESTQTKIGLGFPSRAYMPVIAASAVGLSAGSVDRPNANADS